jgi:hypothetical protein
VQAEGKLVELGREREVPAGPPSFEELFLDVHDRLYRALYFISGIRRDIPRLQRLSGERIRLTHLKDGLAYTLAKKWGVSPSGLQGCPVSLPA